MFCIDNRCTDVYFNLAAEEYLLKKKKDNFFMMWQSVPSVVIGKHQSVRKEVDEKYIHENNILLARRFSGGGAVYHDEGNLNLSFMETVERPDFEYYLQQTVDFLESLGIVAYTDKRMGIYVDDRKVSGSAQCIHKNRVMYHCTLFVFRQSASTGCRIVRKERRRGPAARFACVAGRSFGTQCGGEYQ